MKQCCRICLATDKRTHKLSDTAKRKFIERIFKQHGFHQKVKETHNVCYICDALLTKCYNFIERALRAQHVLAELFKKNDLITIPLLQSIDRLKNRLDYTKLIFHQENINCIDESDEIMGFDNEKIETKDDKQSINNYMKCDRDIDGYNNNVKPINYSHNESHVERNEVLVQIKIENIDVQELAENNSTLDLNTTIATNPLYINANTSAEKELSFNNDLNSSQSKESLITKHEIDVTREWSVGDNNESGYKIEIQLDDNVTSPQAADDKITAKLLDYSGVALTPVKKKRGRPKKVTENGKRSKRKSRESDQDNIPDSGSEADDSPCKRIFPRTCEECEAIITSKREHYYHYLSMHRNIKYPYRRTDKVFVCEICGASTAYKGHFKNHLLLHDNKKFQCEHCLKEYLTRYRLQAHVLRVHSPRQYICDYCNKGFTDKRGLSVHIRIHTGYKPYKCHICRAGFAHGGNLGLHIRVKHQNRPYPSQEKKAQLKIDKSPLGSVDKSKKAPKFKTKIKKRTRQEGVKKKPKNEGGVVPHEILTDCEESVYQLNWQT